MSRRTPLAVAVVGALLIGGATTGTTHASWRDQATMPSSSVTSGSMGLAVDWSGSNLELAAGGGVSTTVVVRDTSSIGAKNLRQAIRVTSIELVNPTAGLSEGDLAWTVERKTANGCSTPGAGALPAALGTTLPGDRFDMCVAVEADPDAPASTGALRIHLAGAQVRPDGSVGGWTSEAETTIPLSVTVSAAPTAPVLRCASDKGAKLVWNATETSYHVYEAGGSLVFGGTPTAIASNEYTKDPFPGGTNATLYFKVRSVRNGTESADSNVMKVRRNGASDNITCGQP